MKHYPRERRYTTQHIMVTEEDLEVIKDFIEKSGHKTSLRKIFEVWWYYYDYNLVPPEELANMILEDINKWSRIIDSDYSGGKSYPFPITILNQLMITADILHCYRKNVVDYLVREMLTDITSGRFTVNTFNLNYNIRSYNVESCNSRRLCVTLDSMVGTKLAKYSKRVNKSLSELLEMWMSDTHLLQFLSSVDLSVVNAKHTVQYNVLVNDTGIKLVKSAVSPLRKMGFKPIRTGSTKQNQYDTYAAIVSLMLYEVAIKLDLVSRDQVKMIGGTDNV